MKIYFDELGKGSKCIYLTAGRLYEVIEHWKTKDGCLVKAKIEDDEGDEIWVNLEGVEPLTRSGWRVIDGTGEYINTPVTDDKSGNQKAWREIVLIAEYLDIPVKYSEGPKNSMVHVGDIMLSGATASVLAATQAVLIRGVKC